MHQITQQQWQHVTINGIVTMTLSRHITIFRAQKRLIQFHSVLNVLHSTPWELTTDLHIIFFSDSSWGPKSNQLATAIPTLAQCLLCLKTTNSSQIYYQGKQSRHWAEPLNEWMTEWINEWGPVFPLTQICSPQTGHLINVRGRRLLGTFAWLVGPFQKVTSHLGSNTSAAYASSMHVHTKQVDRCCSTAKASIIKAH